MPKYKLTGRTFVLATGFIPAAVGGEDETEILNITVGKPTMFNDTTYQNSASVTVFRTSVAAAFFPRARFYRTPRTAESPGARKWFPRRQRVVLKV